MKNILIVYYSRKGHTARMVRTIEDHLKEMGHNVTVMPVSEALLEGVDWDKYDFVLCGFPVLYGTITRTSMNLSVITALVWTENRMRCLT